jgi:hypothetical protein
MFWADQIGHEPTDERLHEVHECAAASQALLYVLGGSGCGISAAA